MGRSRFFLPLVPFVVWAAVACPGPGAPTGLGIAQSGGGGGTGGTGVLAFLVQPTNPVAGRPISPSVRVQAQDTLGNVLTSFTGSISIRLGTNSSSATLSGNTTVPASSGVAFFDTLIVSVPGSGYTLVASASGLTDATSFPFTVLSP